MRVPQRSKLLATVLIGLILVGTAGAWHAPDDPDCFPGFFALGGTQHAQLGTPAASNSPAHCALCHWLRMFRIDGAPHVDFPMDRESHARVADALSTPPLARSLVTAAPRAPPLL